MLRLEQLEYLQAVVRFNSIKLAAESLLVASSTISTALHKIEKETNVKILVRTHHGVEVTEAAREIAEKAEDVFAQLEEIDKIIEKYNGNNSAAGNGNGNKVKLYTSRGYYQGSLRLFFELFEKHGLQVDCPDISRGNETYLKYVDAERNTVLLNYFVEPVHELLEEFPNVEYIKLNSSRPCIICCDSYPLTIKNENEITIKEALKLPFLMFNEGYDLALTIYEWLEEQGEINIVGKYSNISVMSTMVGLGKGVSVSTEKEMLKNMDASNDVSTSKFRIIPIKCDMRISLVLCFNRYIAQEQRKRLRQIAKEIG